MLHNRVKAAQDDLRLAPEGETVDSFLRACFKLNVLMTTKLEFAAGAARARPHSGELDLRTALLVSFCSALRIGICAI